MKTLLLILAIPLMSFFCVEGCIISSNQKISKFEKLFPNIKVERSYSFSDMIGGCHRDKVWINTRHAYQISQKSLNNLILHTATECKKN